MRAVLVGLIGVMLSITGAPARAQDRANQQDLGVLPGAVDKQRRERQDDPAKRAVRPIVSVGDRRWAA